jgi:hypothetical protein
MVKPKSIIKQTNWIMRYFGSSCVINLCVICLISYDVIILDVSLLEVSVEIKFQKLQNVKF